MSCDYITREERRRDMMLGDDKNIEVKTGEGTHKRKKSAESQRVVKTSFANLR